MKRKTNGNGHAAKPSQEDYADGIRALLDACIVGRITTEQFNQRSHRLWETHFKKDYEHDQNQR